MWVGGDPHSDGLNVQFHANLSASPSCEPATASGCCKDYVCMVSIQKRRWKFRLHGLRSSTQVAQKEAHESFQADSIRLSPWPPVVHTNGAAIAVVVPFREQLPLQNRTAQLHRFLQHMQNFLTSIPNCHPIIVIIEQTQDGRKFNRGQLLNIGFKLAMHEIPNMTSFITHDVDLLPSMDMRPTYANTPPQSSAVHLASVWSKYSYGTFIGGVLAFRPAEFDRVNGYPNNYWGWGLEDDQLALRMSHCGVRTLRVRMGGFEDLDPINMKGVLESGSRDTIQTHLPWFNPCMFRKGHLHLDDDWSRNGLRDLQYNVVNKIATGIVRQYIVNIGSRAM